MVSTADKSHKYNDINTLNIYEEFQCLVNLLCELMYWIFLAQSFQSCNPYFIYCVVLKDLFSLQGTCLPTDTNGAKIIEIQNVWETDCFL